MIRWHEVISERTQILTLFHMTLALEHKRSSKELGIANRTVRTDNETDSGKEKDHLKVYKVHWLLLKLTPGWKYSTGREHQKFALKESRHNRTTLVHVQRYFSAGTCMHCHVLALHTVRLMVQSALIRLRHSLLTRAIYRAKATILTVYWGTAS